MLKRQMANRLKIGRFFGIEVFIHWSFWLLFFGIGLLHWGRTGDAVGAAIQMGQIVALFICVTLHEYGHALTARLFGVRTVDITLLPIGGLARLERMPRVPWQELLVAVAGPAVNVVIVLILGFSVVIGILSGWIAPMAQPGSNWLSDLMDHPVGWLILVNISLVVFNMIPAFPMDGGRVFRSLLAMVWEYRTATRVAARVGFVAAIALGLLGILNGLPMIALISLFIGYAGWAEARQVEIVESVRGVRINDGMISQPSFVNATDPLESLGVFFRSHGQTSVAVVGVNQLFLGMLPLGRVVGAMEQARWNLQAADLMDSDVETLRLDSRLDRQLAAIESSGGDLVPVLNATGQLTGMLDLRSLQNRAALARHLLSRSPAFETPILAKLVEKSQAYGVQDTYA